MRRLVLGACLLSAAATGARAQTLDEIAARNLAARGGAHKLAAVQSLRLSGRIQFAAGMSGPFSVERKRPNLMRAEFTLDGALGVQAFDGHTAWSLPPQESAAEPLDARESGEVEEQADLDGPLVDWKAKGHALELVGREKLGARDTWKLRLTTRKGNVRTVFLDAQTLLEACIEGTRTLGGEAVLIESWLSDYRDVGGVQIPFRIESGPKGLRERQRIQFERAELNVPLDLARFRMPTARPSPRPPRP
jgi:hypothetical protein